MKTASVADLRNNFAEVSKWIRAGEAVTITKRGRPFATLQPAGKSDTPPEIDLAARLRTLFPAGTVKGDILDALNEDRGRR